MSILKTSNEDEWKFEYTIKKEENFNNYIFGNKYLYLNKIRIKIYGKSEEKLTSTGVKETEPKDPLWKLLLTGNKPQYKYLRKLLHSNGFVISRYEFSFYGDTL